jgi:long-subunit acyl-CoA synthetase (AMP-forming)
MNPTASARLHALTAAVAPERIALRDTRQIVRYGELTARVTALADWLHAQSCRVVALQLPNGVEWVLFDLACQLADVICLPLPDFFSPAQIAHCLASAQADLLVTQTEESSTIAVDGLAGIFARRLIQSDLTIDPWPNGTQKITFTSGSTGTPKGVCLDTDLQWRVAQSLATVIGLRGMRHLCLLPLATLLENIAGVYAPLLCGGEVVLADANARGLSGSSGLNLPALLHCLHTEQPNTLILLPQLLRALVAAVAQGWRAPASLQFVAVGGARVAPELIDQARARGLPVYEGYGLSECGSVVALNTPAHDRPGCVGQVLPHCRVNIEGGEIIVSGAAHLGYLGEPASWHPARVASGDLGHRDREGFLSIDGRRKHLLITAFGRNVSPEWVESELCAAPLLTQCVVLGDARPHLVAVLGAPDAIDDAAIQSHLDRVNARLPDYARVRAFLRLSSTDWQQLLTANGRPRRDVLQHELTDAIDALYHGAEATPSRPRSTCTESRITP